MSDRYQAFLADKVATAPTLGFEISAGEVNRALKPHQREITRFMVGGGRRACFAAFGLGKTVIGLETVHLTRKHAGGRGLIVAPLGVRQEFIADAVDRLIVQFSQKGETVFDPFGGLMTVPYCALKLGREGLATELNPGYFADGCAYVEAASRAAAIPTLFDLTEACA